MSTATLTASPLTEICHATFGQWSRYSLTVDVSRRFKPEGEVLFSVCDAEQDCYPIRVERNAFDALADFAGQHDFGTMRPRKGDYVINMGSTVARFVEERNGDYVLRLASGGGAGSKFLADPSKCLVLRNCGYLPE